MPQLKYIRISRDRLSSFGSADVGTTKFWTSLILATNDITFDWSVVLLLVKGVYIVEISSYRRMHVRCYAGATEGT